MQQGLAKANSIFSEDPNLSCFWQRVWGSCFEAATCGARKDTFFVKETKSSSLSWSLEQGMERVEASTDKVLPV